MSDGEGRGRECVSDGEGRGRECECRGRSGVVCEWRRGREGVGG